METWPRPTASLGRVAQGVKIHGDVYRTELRSAFSVAWQRTPFIEGGWISWPSQTGPQYTLLNQPAGNVYFAGDWLSYRIAWQHGAFILARKVDPPARGRRLLTWPLIMRRPKRCPHDQQSRPPNCGPPGFVL
jgi:hypothetical protein